MAKKKIEEIPAPIVSPIPISATDSPLVIDLPDGQKLVVGQMPTGTVIEVATWRGTGRPDSRTSRLMLGMSSPEEAAKSANSEDAYSEKSQINSKRIKLPTGFSGILNKLAALTGFSSKDDSKVGAPQESMKSSKFKLPRFKPTLRSKSPKPKIRLRSEKKDSLEDPDFQNWLESITKKNEKLSKFDISEVNKDKIKPSANKKSQKPRRGK